MSTIRDPKEKKRIREGRIRAKLDRRQDELREVRLKLKPQTQDADTMMKSFSFRMQQGIKDPLVGSLMYDRPGRQVIIGSILPEKFHKNIMDTAGTGNYMSLEDVHKRVKGQLMDRKFLQGATEKISKAFPRAEEITGIRVTGRKKDVALGEQTFDINKILKATKRGVKKYGPKVIKRLVR